MGKRFLTRIMSRFLDELRHAFAVDKDKELSRAPLPPVLHRLAEAVVERGMEAPAIVLLETARPFSFLTGQAMLSVWPLLRLAAASEDYKEVAEALERRGTLESLVERIEALCAGKEPGR